MRRGPKATTVGEFLAAVPADKRLSLEDLRKRIRSVVPAATEEISCSVPMFKYEGHPLVSFGAAAEHCSFYVMSPAVVKAHAADLMGYKLGEGSIQFTPDKPLPAAL